MAMPNLDLPPSTPQFDWAQYRDWFFKLWRWVTVTLPGNLSTVLSGLTFGNDPNTYSEAILTTAGQSDIGSANLLGPPIYLWANNTNGQAIPNGTLTTITNWTTNTDTANAFNAATGVYTIPVSGLYCISGALLSSSVAWPAGAFWALAINKNGTVILETGEFTQSAGTSQLWAESVGTFLCAAGDTISIQIVQTQGGVSIAKDTTSQFNVWTLVKVG